MLKKLLLSLLAASISFSPISASADQYIYRYKFGINQAAAPVVTEPENPENEGEYGVGNFIDAYFVAPIGYTFSKEIPVVTRDVVRWERSSGSIPTGIALDDSTGFLTGEPETTGETEALYYGYDGSGKRIARAKIFFSVFNPVGAVNQINWYAHTGNYFYSTVPSPGGVTVTKWVPLLSNPEGMKTRFSAFDGAPGKSGTYAVAWRGYDYMDREVAFTYGEFLVQDGPVVEPIDDQVADKNEGETFDVTANVRHKIGEISYRLVPVAARPSGLVFDSEGGNISGVYDAYETSASFRIEALDRADGRTGLSNVFTLSTTRAVADLRSVPDQTAVIGKPFELQLSIGLKNIKANWNVIAESLPKGLILDSVTGLISGTPVEITKIENIVIQAAGADFDTVTSNPFSFTVLSEELEVVFEEVHARINTSFTSNQPTLNSGNVTPLNFTWNAAEPALALSATSGVVSSNGVAEAGNYDQTIAVENGGGRQVREEQIIRVYNPLAIAYQPENEVTRLSGIMIKPIIPDLSVAPPATFELLGAPLPSWLKFNERSGTFSGKPEERNTMGIVGPYQVRVTDRFNEPVTSNSFTIKVVDRPQMEISIPDPFVERYVINDKRLAFDENAQGKASFTVLQGGDILPSTLRILNDGRISGTTTLPVGTKFENIVIEVRDEDDYSARSEPFDLEVVEPDLPPLAGSFNKTFKWTVGKQFENLQVGTPSNGYGPITYTIADNPFGIVLSDRNLVGAINEIGTFPVTYTIDDDTAREPVTGTLTFEISETDLGNIDFKNQDLTLRRGEEGALTLTVDNVVQPVIFSFSETAEQYPGSITFDPTTGSVVGRFNQAGDYLTTFKVVDALERTKEATVSFEVIDDLALEVPDTMTFQRFVQGKTDVKTSNSMGSVSYRLSENSPPLPAGLTLNGISGRISGEAEVVGVTEGYVLIAKDDYDGQEALTAPFSIEVTPRPEIEIVSAENQTALYDHSYHLALAKRNVIGDVTWQLLSSPNALPAGVSFNPSTGVFYGTPTAIATYPNVEVRMTDTYRGEAVSVNKTFSFDVKQDGTPILLSVSPVAGRVGFFVSTDKPTVGNTIGTITWSVSGLDDTGLVFDPLTGIISGIPTRPFTRPIALKVTDSIDREQTFPVEFEILGPIVVSMNDTDLTYNYPYEEVTTNQPEASSTFGDNLDWSIVDETKLPEGITLNRITGEFQGKPKAIGAFGPIQIRVTDELPGVGLSAPFWFTVYMNEDPIELEVTNFLTKIGYNIETVAPTFDNTLGDYNFYFRDLEGEDLLINEETGVLTGMFSTPQDRNINIAITDYTKRVTSKPLRLQVLPLMSVVGPETFTVYAQEEMPAEFVTRHYVIGDAVWHPVDSSLLPHGMTFNTVTGAFEGTPQEIGEFGPIYVSSTDSIGDVGTSNPIMITSQPGAKYLALNDAILPPAVKRTENYTYDLKTHLNVIGIPENQLSWKWSGNGTGLPDGLSIPNGVITGTPTIPGTYSVKVTVSGEGRSAEHIYQIVVQNPEIGLALADTSFGEIESESPFNFDFRSVLTPTNIPLADVAWSVSDLPGATITNGILDAHMSGIPIPDGQQYVDHSFTVKASFQDGSEYTEGTRTYVLRVKKVQVGATWWRFTPTAKHSTPAGTRPVIRLSIQTAAGIGINTLTDKIVSKEGGFAFNSTTNVTSSYVDIGVASTIRFSEPINAVKATLQHSATSTHPKVSKYLIESSMDGVNWTVHVNGSLSISPSLVTVTW